MTYSTTTAPRIQPAERSGTHCSKPRRRSVAASTAPPQSAALDPLWLPVAALVCGSLSAAALLAPTHWTGLQTIASSVLTAAAVALGCVAVARQERGQGLAMAGVALGAVGLMGATAAHLF